MIIVKIGGGAAIDLESIAIDIAALEEPVIVVHGANALRDELAERLGNEVRRVTSLSGYESVLTDEEAIDLLMLAYAGLRNKRLVEKLQRAGVNAVGLTGLDGRVVTGQRNKGIRTWREGRKMLLRDLSGKPRSINTALLTHLLERGYVPVLTVPIMGEDGRALNTENDEVVAVLQQHLQADRVAHLIEAPGLLGDPHDASSLIPELTFAALAQIEQEAEGRMKRKLKAIGRLEGSVVFIGDGRIGQPLTSLLAGKGTVIR
jgi:acetylglutamate/LysW-gamma-L-alpha-aminoadipate kinase